MGARFYKPPKMVVYRFLQNQWTAFSFSPEVYKTKEMENHYEVYL